MAGRSWVTTSQAYPRSAQVPGIGNSMGGRRTPMQPSYPGLGGTPTPMHGMTPESDDFMEDERFNVAFDVVACSKFDDIIKDGGESQLAWAYRDAKENSESTNKRGDIIYAKNTAELNRYLKSEQGRKDHPYCSSARIAEYWALAGVQEGKTRDNGDNRRNYHCGLVVRLPWIWGWSGRVPHDRDYLWMVFMVIEDATMKTDAALLARAGMEDPEEKKRLTPPTNPIALAMRSIAQTPLQPWQYWACIPMVTRYPSAPTAKHYCNSAFEGHCVYVGVVTRVLEGDTTLRERNAKLAKLAIHPVDTSDDYVRSTINLPWVEVHYGVR